jgi:hypothetical protein
LFTGTNTFAGVVIATNANNLLNGTFIGNLTGNVTGSLAGNAATASTAGSATTAATANDFSGNLVGDVTGTQAATVVTSVGGQPAANVASGASAANAATSANTPGTIVQRDGTGDFSAGGITAGHVSAATLTGDGSGVTNLNGANLVGGSVGSTQIANGAVGANQLGSGVALANLQASGQSGVPSGGMVLSTSPAAANLFSAGYTKIGTVLLGEAGWSEITNNFGPSARLISGCAVWTGAEVIFWGGLTGALPPYVALADGVRYNPGSGTFQSVTTNGAPAGRFNASTVWTGTEMIIWGGDDGTNALGDGARYNPVTDTWTPLPSLGAPSARELHNAAWTGTDMLVWGGQDALTATSYFGDGARYNPASNAWYSISLSNAPSARSMFASVWTGSQMIIWGGQNGGGGFADGRIYTPSTDSWTAMSGNGAPLARSSSTAVWTGTQMIVWGGNTLAGGSYLNTGALYTPSSDSWASMTSSGAPSARTGVPPVWTGTEMIVWGGYSWSNSEVWPGDGARYNPLLNIWTSMPSRGAPLARFDNMAIWTGAELVIYGGWTSPGIEVNDAFTYSPPIPAYLYLKP